MEVVRRGNVHHLHIGVAQQVLVAGTGFVPVMLRDEAFARTGPDRCGRREDGVGQVRQPPCEGGRDVATTHDAPPMDPRAGAEPDGRPCPFGNPGGIVRRGLQLAMDAMNHGKSDTMGR